MKTVSYIITTLITSAVLAGCVSTHDYYYDPDLADVDVDVVKFEQYAEQSDKAILTFNDKKRFLDITFVTLSPFEYNQQEQKVCGIDVEAGWNICAPFSSMERAELHLSAKPDNIKDDPDVTNAWSYVMPLIPLNILLETVRTARTIIDEDPKVVAARKRLTRLEAAGVLTIVDHEFTQASRST